MAKREAMKDYVEATERVTGILIRLGAGETVESEEIEDARRQGVGRNDQIHRRS